MTLTEILNLPRKNFQNHCLWVALLFVVLTLASFYPTNLKENYATSRGGHNDILVTAVEDYGRHINTLLPFATILLLRDWTGLKQAAAIIVVGTLASHGPKRLLNDVYVGDTRLGQRPKSPESRHNMPSGHATLASAAAYFLMRRYSLKWGLIVLPVMLLTMYARVMLDAHTVSAVIAGAATGILVSLLFSSKRHNSLAN